MISQARLREVSIIVTGVDERDETLYIIDKMRIN
jgi:hypothetical protein